MKTGIYKITCLFNNRIYIGQSVNIEHRLRCHISLLKKNQHFNCYLQRSFNKYTEANFTFEIIEECEQRELCEREDFWIKNLKSESKRKGFNLAEPDGKGKYRHSEETKKKLSKIKQGFKHSEKTKIKLSQINKLLFLSGELKGYKKSAESRRIKVSQYTMDGILIKKWNSATEASTILKLDVHNILATCSGRYKHCGYFRWGRGDILPELKQRKKRIYEKRISNSV